MKKLSILLLCLTVTLSISAQKTKTVEAKGPVVKKEQSAANFTGIHVATGIDVYLTQGNSFSVSLETEENLHEYIQIKVEDDVLEIFSKVNIKNSKVKKVYVTMKEIKDLTCSSAGSIFGETSVKAEKLNLTASSAGELKLNVTATKVLVDCSSAGDINLSGKADYLRASVSSAGDLNANDLSVKEADCDASSSGDINVNVSDKLTAHASSLGDIKYSGNPQVDKHTSSMGEVKKK